MGWPPTTVPSFNPFIPHPAVESLISEDEQGNPIPLLASGWKYSDDRTQLTFTLNKGIKFHDGTDFNAASVKWDLDALKESGQPEMAAVESIDVIDPYTVRLNLSSYSFVALNDLYGKAGDVCSISPTAIKNNGVDWATSHAVGTGPFKMTKFTRSVGVEFERFTDYWQEGKPYLDAIQTTFQPDLVTGKAAFLAGEADIFAGIAPADAADIVKTGKGVITTSPSSAFGMISDSSNPDSPFYKLEVRQAVSYAIDNQAICTALGYGYWEPTNQLGFENNQLYNPDVVGYPYNPEKARELLAAAGYPDGFDTSIIYMADKGFDNIFVAVQRFLSEVGIRAELKPAAGPAYQTYGANGWENALFQMKPYMAVGYPAAKTIDYYFSATTPRGKSALHPDEVEQVKLKAFSSTTLDEYLMYCQEMNKLIIDKYCTFNPLFVIPNIAAKYPYAQGDEIFTIWQEVWRPQNAWLDK
jgi:ABC-type transport system substrate-binding protein